MTEEICSQVKQVLITSLKNFGWVIVVIFGVKDREFCFGLFCDILYVGLVHDCIVLLGQGCVSVSGTYTAGLRINISVWSQVACFSLDALKGRGILAGFIHLARHCFPLEKLFDLVKIIIFKLFSLSDH